MHISYLTLLFACISLFTLGQDLEHTKLEWDENPTWSEIDTAEMKDQEIVTEVNEIIEFAYSEEYNNALIEYRTRHKKVRVFGEDAIQSNNKVYIPMSMVIDLVDARARVITPDGKVIDLDESNIQESEGGDGYGAYKYFAIDGVVVGSDIEYIYTIGRIPDYEGRRISPYETALLKKGNFTLASPDNLIFALKSYNGMPEFEKDTVTEDKNRWSLSMEDVAPVPDEKYSAPNRSMMYTVYKLDRNLYNGKNNLVSFADATKNIFGYYHGELDKPSQKKVAKLVKESGAQNSSDEEEKVRKFESFLKNKIAVLDGVETKPISDILKDGFTSGRGMNLLMIRGLMEMDVKHEIVVTTDRYDDNFDRDFEHYQMLRNIMLYLPKIDKYIAPSEMAFRIGMVPPDWTNQDGLFIRSKTIGDVEMGLGKVKFIEPLPASETKDEMVVSVDMSDLTELMVDFKRVLTGYSAASFQAFYPLMDEDARKELNGTLVSFADDKGEVIEYTVTGTDSEDVGVKPLIYEGKLKPTTLLEKAGNRYLFNVGKLIGQQAEMYQESERVMDIEHDHNMIYDRQITFTIPDGYKLSGLEDLKINETFPVENPTISFISDYKQEGNTITINVLETYEQINFPKEDIDDFRRIINAAANFNGIVLFLIKE
jgi:hypothetical protein